MQKSILVKWFLLAALPFSMTAAKAQTAVTPNPSHSATNRNPETQLQSNAAVMNFAIGNNDSTRVERIVQRAVYTSDSTHGPVITAPEPSSMLLFGSGLVLFGVILRRVLRTHPKGK